MELRRSTLILRVCVKGPKCDIVVLCPQLDAASGDAPDVSFLLDYEGTTLLASSSYFMVIVSFY